MSERVENKDDDKQNNDNSKSIINDEFILQLIQNINDPINEELPIFLSKLDEMGINDDNDIQKALYITQILIQKKPKKYKL